MASTAAPYSAAPAVDHVPPISGWVRRFGPLVVVLMAVVVLVVSGQVGAASDDGASAAAAVVVVEPGQTLWDVAVATAGDGVDPRAQLEAIRAANDLSGAALPAWTVLVVPAA